MPSRRDVMVLSLADNDNGIVIFIAVARRPVRRGHMASLCIIRASPILAPIFVVTFLMSFVESAVLSSIRTDSQEKVPKALLGLERRSYSTTIFHRGSVGKEDSRDVRPGPGDVGGYQIIVKVKARPPSPGEDAGGVGRPNGGGINRVNGAYGSTNGVRDVLRKGKSRKGGVCLVD